MIKHKKSVSIRPKITYPNNTARGDLRSSVFPLEIAEYIIDFLCCDKAALSTYAIVCRSWIDRSQSHLFKTVPPGCVEKLALLLDTNPLLATHVKVIGITGGTVPGLAPKLTKVQWLRIEHHGFDSEQHSVHWHALFEYMTNFSSITHLTIRRCAFISSQQIFSFVAAFCQLKKLELFESYVLHPASLESDTATSYDDGLRLHLIYLQYIPFAQTSLLDWIRANYTSLSVKTLYVACDIEADSVAKFITGLSDALYNLIITKMGVTGSEYGLVLFKFYLIFLLDNHLLVSNLSLH